MDETEQLINWLTEERRLIESLTDDLRHSLLSALRELEREGTTSIPEAVLLAILSERKLGYHALKSLGVDMDHLRAVAARSLHAGKDQPSRTSRLLIPII